MVKKLITEYKIFKRAIKSLRDFDYEKAQKLFDEKTAKINRDADFWHRQFKKYSFTECAQCCKRLMLWPYENESYYHVAGNKAVHSACHDEYLGESNG